MAAKRGRPAGKTGVAMSDTHRAKIRAVNIINALQEHVEGAREMSATQITAGLGLLRKVLPDLTHNDNEGEIVHKHILARPLTAEEWAAQHGASV